VKLTKPDWHTVAGVFACIVLLTLPFAHSGAIRTIAMGLACVAALATWRQLAVPHISLLWLFGAWAVLGLLSLTWAIDLEYSAAELKTELLYPFLTFVLFFAVSDLQWLERFRRTLMAATVLALVSALYWAALPDGGRADGFFNGPGMYTTYLIAVYPFALLWVVKPDATLKERLAHALVMFAIFVGGAVTLNRMLWIVLALQTVLVLAVQAGRRLDASSMRRLALVAMATTFIFGGALYGTSSKRFVVDPSAPEAVAETATKDIRLRIWPRAVEHIVERPLTGAGFGRGALRQDFREAFGGGLYWHAHNVVLNHGMAMGVWGIAIILLAFGLVLVLLWRVWRSGDATVAPYALAGVAMVVGMFLKNMTDDLFIRQSALLYWALAGMILGAYTRRQRT
jgi:O-antigen ligase